MRRTVRPDGRAGSERKLQAPQRGTTRVPEQPFLGLLVRYQFDALGVGHDAHLPSDGFLGDRDAHVAGRQPKLLVVGPGSDAGTNLPAARLNPESVERAGRHGDFLACDDAAFELELAVSNPEVP